MSDLNREQPAPVPRDGRPIWDLVVEDMQARDREGRKKYGVPLQAHNGRDALVDGYQEALDLCVYLRQAIEERRAGAAAEGLAGYMVRLAARLARREGVPDGAPAQADREYGEAAVAVRKAADRIAAWERIWQECPGHGRGGQAPKCCERAGEHDGSGGGEYRPDFHCPKGCSCHD